ncbi:modification methylase, HemK family [Rippkaea orientalis PCC 8801]|uniref:Release factor glutamine methyltransferase n=1 Tax=Rippkaea orientalis (strain PCC 8801 / RF-1) TaxID=41431 RepID=B7JV62_RIPO1|nr:peptide chain release factor N(5)-glutamine methyltransferase [Rippkaea orientalis]ACK66914.1 modification methylase, HemK family [Rippkaea orientalis PCC 8801]
MGIVNVSGQELAKWRNWAKTEAVNYHVPSQEVDWLLQDVAQLDALSLRLESFKGRSPIPLKFSLSDLTQLWENRLKDRVPVQYLVGVTPWRNFSLKVSPSVLIPRPETELIIDFAVKAVKDSPRNDLALGHWVDLGTGSGAIACGLAQAFPKAIIHAVDSSEAALAIAQENANNLGFSSRINFYQGSWWTPLESLKGKISGVLSNPPYIPTKMLSALAPEVRDHEPYLALDGGEDGLDSLRYLINSSPDYLYSGGIWLVEMMAGQGEKVAQLLTDSTAYKDIKILSDLAGIDRFALAYCN